MRIKQSFVYLFAFLSVTLALRVEAARTSRPLKAAMFVTLAAMNSPVIYGDDIDLCCLCDRCGPPVSGREDLFVDANGKTCTDLVLEMADPRNDSTVGSDKCEALIEQFSARCCDPNHNPLPIEQDPTDPPRGDEPGEHPVCNLCKNGSFPKNPNTVIVALPEFIPGTNTCRDLYWMGLNGELTDQICRPLQNFAEVPCGCEDDEPSLPPTQKPDDISNYPPKKERPRDSSKDSSKLHQGDRDRGGLHLRQARRLRTKGL